MPRKKVQQKTVVPDEQSEGEEISLELERMSQESEQSAMMKLLDDMVSKTRARREGRRDKIKKEYNDHLARLRKKVQAHNKASSDASMQAHKTQLARLTNLVMKKLEIEKDIMQKISELESVYKTANLEMDLVMKAKIKKLSTDDMAT
ncbi:MAG: hypothetical protein M1834_003589 [Cirrosporium novae-zelandiae]|nr:MAG: hypothetical protein M1834_003589 [Cirrosporium novae-zelandiae]